MSNRREITQRLKDANRVLRMIANNGSKVFKYGFRESEFTLSAAGRLGFFYAKTGTSYYTKYGDGIRKDIARDDQRWLVQAMFDFILYGERVGRHHLRTPPHGVKWCHWAGYHYDMADIIALADALGVLEPPAADTRPVHQDTGA